MPGPSIDSRSAPRLPPRYRLTGHIANGGMAAVWAADDLTLGRGVAIKVLASHLAEDPRNTLRFEREARAAARLSNHPGVVTIYDVGESEGRAFIVMEHVRGGSVADAVRAAQPGRVDREEALGWLRDAAGALDAAHAEGIVHRDIKPANILLTAQRRALVADFGIARISTEATMTSTGEMLGTAAYLSPEQALGQPTTAASDRYALAVVAYELLTGTRPFAGEHFAAQARQHVEVPAPPASSRAADLPHAADPVFERGLAKEPGERWATARAFVAALSDALAGGEKATDATVRMAPQTLTARAPVAPQAPPAVPVAVEASAPVERSAPRRSGRAAVLALAAVAALAGLVAVLSPGGADKKPPAPARPTAARSAPAKKKAAPKPEPAASTPTTPGATTAPPSAPATGSASALQSRAHALLATNPAAAVPLLQQAVAASGGSVARCRTASTGACLTYAYSLFDLGQALRLSGRPAEAIPVLAQRALIQNQAGTVQAELALARRQAGGGAAAPSGKGEKGSKRKGD